ncbi:hypothetical protein [Flavobacterium sp. LAR06]
MNYDKSIGYNSYSKEEYENPFMVFQKAFDEKTPEQLRRSGNQIRLML